MSIPARLTLFHNPRCSTSRRALALLQASGAPFQVVDYARTGWTRDQLDALSRELGGAHALLRSRHPRAAELGTAGEEAVLEAMRADPLLVERPIVWGPGGALLARPVERLSRYLSSCG